MQRVLSSFVLAVVVMAGMLVAGLPVSAQNIPEVTFTNSTPITIPTVVGNASPYPSAINVSGLTGNIANTAGSVRVTINNFSHTFASDIGFVLVGPTGAALLLYDGACGDLPNNNLTITFSDTGAANLPDTTACTSGTFKPTTFFTGDSFPAPGPLTAYNNPGPAGGGTATFSSTYAGTNPNGTWNLYVRDFVNGDGGQFAGGWTLDITTTGGGPATPDAELDYNGDGKSDYSIVRPGATAADAVTWWNFWNGVGPQSPVQWGIQTDEFVPKDYDGDTKDDIAVFRPGSPATWYIINSNGNTLRVETFGQTGDDPSVVADYNGDNKDDIAVYRVNPTAGGTNTWYYKPQGAGFTAVTFGINSGNGGDYPAPGDYDGDNRADFVVQRNQGGTNVFYKLLTTGSFSSENFGTFPAFSVPGDYDGDTKTDVATVSAVGGNWQWNYRSSQNGSTVTDTWGVAATDVPIVGNYCGDTKSDYAIWRPGAVGTFFTMTPVTRNICQQSWGTNGDLPVGFTYVH